MGYNTSMIVLNDALGSIEKDTEFGKKVANAVNLLHRANNIDIPSGCNVNAATVVETHHADSTAILAFGGNNVSVLHETYGYRHNDPDFKLRLLKELAESLGYTVVKKPKKKPAKKA